MKLPSISRPLIVTSLLIAATSAASAIDINWGSDYGDSLFRSNGSALTSSFRFELGTFTAGFNPQTNDTGLWAANWKPFDSASVGDGWFPNEQFVTASAELRSDGTSGNTALAGLFNFTGTQAYVWAFNTQSAGGEWALITNNTWTFAPTSNPTALPLDWQLRAANQVVFGGLNSQQGAGGYTVTPTGTWTLQTHSTVPEPGSALFVGSIGVLARLRRRRA